MLKRPYKKYTSVSLHPWHVTRGGEVLTKPSQLRRTRGWRRVSGFDLFLCGLLLIGVIASIGLILAGHFKKLTPDPRIDTPAITRPITQHPVSTAKTSDPISIAKPKSDSNPTPITVTSRAEPASVPKIVDPTLKPVSIVTGLIRRAKKPIGMVATLKIETPDTANYVIKVIRADTGSEELLIYVRGGETFETNLPFGSYKIWIASGRTWYGEQHYFAKDTVFSEVTRRVSDADQESLDHIQIL